MTQAKRTNQFDHTLLRKQFPGATEIRPWSKPGRNGIPFIVTQGERYFVKVLDASQVARERSLGLDEVEACKLVESNHVIKLLEHGELDGGSWIYLKFPFVEGGTVDQLRQRPPGRVWPNSSLLELGKQVAVAIRDMWRDGRGVVHRDLKPKNIMRGKDGKFIVLDLGIAHLLHLPDRDTAKRHAGSVDYSAPELFRAAVDPREEITFAADHYSLGAILYELATGRYYLEGTSKGDMASAISERLPVSPRSFNSDLSPDLEAIIMRLLQKHASDRYGCPEELIAAFDGTDYESPSIHPPKFYVHVGDNQVRFLLEYAEEVEGPDEMPEGLILPISNLPSDENIELLRNAGYSLIIDPETYRMQYSGHSNALKKRLDLDTIGGHHLGGLHDPIGNLLSFLGDASKAEAFVRAVLSFQERCQPTSLIAPYFVIESTADPIWDIQPRLWKLSRRAVERSTSSMPLLGGLALSTSLLRTPDQKRALLDRLWAFHYLDGFYLVIQNEERDDSGPITNVETLRGLKEFVEKLSAQYRLVVGHADLTLFPLMQYGVVATSPDRAVRKFSIETLKAPRKLQQGRKTPEKQLLRYYSPQLMDFIEDKAYLGQLARLKLQDRIACDCRFCRKADHFNEKVSQTAESVTNARKHFIVNVAKEVTSVGGLERSKRREHYVKRLRSATALGEEISKSTGARKRLARYDPLLSLLQVQK